MQGVCGRINPLRGNFGILAIYMYKTYIDTQQERKSPIMHNRTTLSKVHKDVLHVLCDFY